MSELRREEASVLWRRLDVPAFDLCRLWTGTPGHVLEGHVLIAVEDAPCAVRYSVECDELWNTRSARVSTATAAVDRELDLRRGPDGAWLRNAEELAVMDGLTDVDLGFTPATNTLPIRRLSLEPGQAADVTAVWVRFPELTVERLEQRYTRLDANRYRYESRAGSFVAELEVDERGLVSRYAGIADRVATWVAPSGGAARPR